MNCCCSLAGTKACENCLNNRSWQVVGKLAYDDIARVTELKDTMKDSVIKLDEPNEYSDGFKDGQKDMLMFMLEGMKDMLEELKKVREEVEE